MTAPMIIANWKMNMDLQGVRAWCQTMASHPWGRNAQVVVCPASIHLLYAAGRLVELGFSLGAQDVSDAPKGAYTGQISAAMLRDAGCTHCLVGHSERRAYCHESDAQIHEKIRHLWQEGLTPILCVGETKEERDAGQMQNVLSRQIKDGLPASQAKDRPFIIAYEPRWSIGTGLLPTIQDMEAAHAYIRTCVQEHVGSVALRILYGGSVTPQNASEILSISGVDGLLVGGASLDPEGFCHIVNQAEPQSGRASDQIPTTSLAV